MATLLFICPSRLHTSVIFLVRKSLNAASVVHKAEMEVESPPPVPSEPKSFRGEGTGVDAMAGMTTGHDAGRRSGRVATEMRKISVSQGVLTRADGSARIKMGATDVLVAVYGPMECPVPRQRSDAVQVHVSYRKREGNVTSDGIAAGKECLAARDLRQLVLEILLAAMHPRKAVVVAVQVLADNGGMAAAAINASVVALIDAGVPMRAVPTAACVSVHNGLLVVDPERVEEVEADAVLTFTFDTVLASEKGFMSVCTEGDCGGDVLFATAVETCRDLATKIRAFLKLSLQEKASYQYIWNAAPVVT